MIKNYLSSPIYDSTRPSFQCLVFNFLCPFLFLVIVTFSGKDYPAAWAETGWYGESLPKGLSKGTVYGEYLHQKDNAIMVYVPAGSFLRGTSQAQVKILQQQFGNHYAVETPQRWIYLSSYYIDKFEVTNQQYARFLKALENEGHRSCHPDEPAQKNHTPTYWQDARLKGADYPVTGVDWYDAYAYCHWAGKHLPTEAQWEKAARGTDGREFPWGDKWEASYSNNAESTFGQTFLSKKQWMDLLSRLHLDELKVLTKPVGSFPQGVSPYGAHDMAGNVWEWCQDSYQKDYYRESPSRDPSGPSPSEYKVLRGGCWDSDRTRVRTAYRNYDILTDRHLEIGFRCAQ
ncbi:MAG TPA: formylglycine-generating enzyme family protein [Candidatus Limnocylindrales bacterium]|nr:formylglycine-generating enzyme family protein [Candidatus Limnocylindrales bacterium]